MPFIDIVELFDYWVEYPPAHILLRGYTGYEPKEKETKGDPLVTALQIAGSNIKAKSMKNAPPDVQAKFARLKEQAKELKGA